MNEQKINNFKDHILGNKVSKKVIKNVSNTYFTRVL